MGKFVETSQNTFPARLTTFFTFKYLQLVDYFHMRCSPIPLALFRILFGKNKQKVDFFLSSFLIPLFSHAFMSVSAHYC